MIWAIDGNNVMGARADGWWNDKVGAAARLAQTIARWSRTHDDPVWLIFDGPHRGVVAEAAGGRLEVAFSGSTAPNSADDAIVTWVEDRFGDPDVEPDITVVTSDRGLLARLPPGVTTMGAGSFLRRLDG